VSHHDFIDKKVRVSFRMKGHSFRQINGGNVCVVRTTPFESDFISSEGVEIVQKDIVDIMEGNPLAPVSSKQRV
jgi:hypothetical protein